MDLNMFWDYYRIFLFQSNHLKLIVVHFLLLINLQELLLFLHCHVYRYLVQYFLHYVHYHIFSIFVFLKIQKNHFLKNYFLN